ncbi:MAG: metallophosphoesterase, partial [Cyanobacteria bacterium J06597_16]
VVTKALEQADISVLWNEIATPMGEDFPIVGFADYWSQEFDPAVLDRLSPDVARLVLSHNPDTAENLAEWRVDLQLSGHTHGGQVYIPGFGSGPLVWRRLRQRVPRPIRNSIPFLSDKCFHTVRHWEWGQGLHQINGNWLYVNRGLGTYYPGRFFCPPELTVLTLEKG